MRSKVAAAVVLVGVLGVAPALAVCPGTTTDCPSPTFNQVTIGNGGTLSGTFGGSPMFSGSPSTQSVTFTGNTTAERPTCSSGSYPVGYNTTLDSFEWCNGTTWLQPLPTSGGEITGGLGIGVGAPGTGQLSVSQTDNSATGSGLASAVAATSNETNSGGSKSFWTILGKSSFNGVSATVNGATYVGVFAQGVRGRYVAGGAAANPSVWGGIWDSVDLTNVQSSLTAPQLNEDDLEANGVDDANNRQNLSIVLFNAQTNHQGAGVNPTAWNAIHISSPATGGGYKFGLLGGFTFDTAAIDLRNTYKDGALQPTVTTATTGATVSVSDVLPFTSDRLGLDLNLSGNGHVNAEVEIGGTWYTETGYTVTGNGTGANPDAGTITLTTNCTTCTQGASVSGNAHWIWLPAFGDIAFDYSGANGLPNVYIYGDTTDLNINGGLKITGSLTINGGALIVPKSSAAPSAPGAGNVEIFAVTGTNSGTCKLQAIAGTSTTPVTIVDNVGSGC